MHISEVNGLVRPSRIYPAFQKAREELKGLCIYTKKKYENTTDVDQTQGSVLCLARIIILLGWSIK